MTDASVLEKYESSIISAVLGQLVDKLNLIKMSCSLVDPSEHKSGVTLEENKSKDDTVLTPKYRLFKDCEDIQNSLVEIIDEISTKNTFEKLKETVRTYITHSTEIEKQQEEIKRKKAQIEELKRALPCVRDETEKRKDYIERENIKKKDQLLKDDTSFDQIAYIQKVINHKAKEEKQMYDQEVENLKLEIAKVSEEEQEDEATYIQIVVFWLSMYEEYLKILDTVSRKAFDDLKSKERNFAIVKKYKEMNLKKIELVKAEVEIREKVIEEDRRLKQLEKERLERLELKRKKSIIIQAWWRGMMVRHFLGPYKYIKKLKDKKKKGKGKKAKGKGKKGKK